MLKQRIKSLLRPLRPVYRRFFPVKTLRQEIAARYLHGLGIEIGALHFPLKLPRGAGARYVDRMTVAELRRQYPELNDVALVPLDIVDDGEVLGSLEEASQDFVIANHLIEHCQNPLAALHNWLRVLKTGGILFLAVPDKRHTFDRNRALTSLEHILRDYNEGPEWSRVEHFLQFANLEGDRTPDETAAYARHLADINYSIHFHVWTPMTFLELLHCCHCQLLFPFDIELFQNNGDEFIVVLRKQEI